MFEREELFDRAEEYEEMLGRGLRLSGESSAYFLRGRVADLVEQLPESLRPVRILDFGCGLGHTTAHLARLFPAAEVHGVDTSRDALRAAVENQAGDRVTFGPLASLGEHETFDLCYVNGVFHHIAPGERAGSLRMIRQALAPGGVLAVFENNPFNPGTRLVMRRIPFDRDAVPLRPSELRSLLRAEGFALIGITRYLFIFPAPLRWLRSIEPRLTRLPFGAQYWVMARAPVRDRTCP